MNPSALDDTLSGPARLAVSTGAASQAELQSYDDPVREDREGWLRMVDRFLVEWGRDPQALADAGVEPPSGEIIVLAAKWAERAAKFGWAAPTRVVPTGDGGIAFELRSGDLFQSLEILADGRALLTTYIDCRLDSRYRLA